MCSKDTELLCDAFLRDPSQSWNNRNAKRSPESAVFLHKNTSKGLWIDGPQTPSSVQPKSEGLKWAHNKSHQNLPKMDFQERKSLLDVLKSCGKEKDLSTTTRIHVDIEEIISKDVYIGTALLSAYAKCGALEKAQEVFEKLSVRDTISWNALISAYGLKGLHEKSLDCFKQMQEENVNPNSVTYICILKACTHVGSLSIVDDMNAEVRKQGLLAKDVALGNVLVDMYAKHGALKKAREVFEELPIRNVVSWTTIITGYLQHGFEFEALKCFKQMQDEGISPDSVTYICILKACGNVASLEMGENIDAEIRKQGLLKKDLVLGNGLIDMYAKCGAPEKAREVFELLPVRNVISWTALIAGYVRRGLCHEALECFRKMQDEKLAADVVTYICVLKACGIVRSLDIGKEIDVKVRKQGLLRKDIVLGNALLDMYVKCGALKKAREVFDEISSAGDIVTWTTLMAGYVQHGLGGKALKCFWNLKEKGVSPNVITYICALKACGIVSSLETGKAIDAEVRENGLLRTDAVLGSALVDMYVKCGALPKAQEVFQELPVRNNVSWTSLMVGYAQLGQTQVVFELYDKMKAEGISPDLVTFHVLLTACSQDGLLEEGEKLFDEMGGVYSLTPTREHYTCMIDLFDRVGCLDKAKDLLDNVLSSSDRRALFLTLLGRCRKSGNAVLGRWAFEHAAELDEKSANV